MIENEPETGREGNQLAITRNRTQKKAGRRRRNAHRSLLRRHMAASQPGGEMEEREIEPPEKC